MKWKTQPKHRQHRIYKQLQSLHSIDLPQKACMQRKSWQFSSVIASAFRQFTDLHIYKFTIVDCLLNSSCQGSRRVEKKPFSPTWRINWSPFFFTLVTRQLWSRCCHRKWSTFFFTFLIQTCMYSYQRSTGYEEEYSVWGGVQAKTARWHQYQFGWKCLTEHTSYLLYTL